MNLIICSLDTLRADMLGTLGHSGGLTPNLDRIASEGAILTQTYASDIPTQPSHTALFTGQFGINTGIVSHFHPPALLEGDSLWLPTIMKRRGYATGAVDHLFAMKGWFKRGYHDYMPPPGRSRSPGSEINQIGMEWMDEHREQDFFLFLHFWDAHIPYVPPSPFKERYTQGSAGRIDKDVITKLQSRPSYPLFKQNLYDFLDVIPNLDYIADLYDAEVAYLDYEIGRLFEYLEEKSLIEDTVVVLFGDHGENMTEHDSWFDHDGLYDTVTHVPLILWAPGRVPAARSDAFVQLVDVLPTIYEIFDFPPPADIDGRSLMPLLRGETTSHRDVVYLSEATWEASRGIRTDQWKFIKYLQPTIYGRHGTELYNLHDDPEEQRNLVEAEPDVAAKLEAQLDNWVADQLNGRTDPMVGILNDGLPAVARLRSVIEEQTALPEADAAVETGGGVAVGVAAGVAAGAVGAAATTALAESHTDLVPAGDALPDTVAPSALAATDDGKPDGLQRFSPGAVGRHDHRKRRGLVIGGIAVVAAGLLGWAVDDVLLSAPLSVSGVLEPTQSAQLNLPQTGIISSLPVTVGEVVHAGQVLATEDTSQLQGTLAAAEAKLAADKATLAQDQRGTSGAQLAELEAEVTSAETNLSAAQAKLSETETTTAAAVAAASQQVQTDKSLLATDQTNYQAILPQCLGASPPAACATDERQIQVDQGTLATDQSAESQAVANQSAENGAAQQAVSQASSAVTVAEAAVTAASAPATPGAIQAAQALVQQDEATIQSDKAQINQGVLVAPFSGIVAAVNGTVGEVATATGVREPTQPGSVASQTSGFINLFPTGSTTSQTPTPTDASLLALDSFQTKIIVQVPEADINQVHVGESATASLPAFPGSTFGATVTKIEPTSVQQGGTTYFLVDMVANSKSLDRLVRSQGTTTKQLRDASGYTVDVSF